MIEGLEFHIVDEFAHCGVVRADLAAVRGEVFWAAGRPLVGAKGRGGASVLELQRGVTGVVRDYRRGGALGFLFRRSYFDRWRSRRELQVLAALRHRGVPVVAPLAALARRRFLIFHRLRLITVLLSRASPLMAFVAASPELRRAAVSEAGRVVELAMAAGLVHRDLHPDNLMARCGEGRVEVYILDLDRAEIRPELTTAQRDKMLLRMARYLCRHAGELPVRPAATDSIRFLAGMGLDRSARRAALARLIPMYKRQLGRRGLR